MTDHEARKMREYRLEDLVYIARQCEHTSTADLETSRTRAVRICEQCRIVLAKLSVENGVIMSVVIVQDTMFHLPGRGIVGA